MGNESKTIDNFLNKSCKQFQGVNSVEKDF